MALADQRASLRRHGRDAGRRRHAPSSRMGAELRGMDDRRTTSRLGAHARQAAPTSTAPPMITLRTSSSAAAPRCCWTTSPSPSTPARRSAWWAATAPASRRSSRCSTAACTRTAATFRCRAQWRMAQVAQDMPETAEVAPPTFVLAGDTRLAELRAGSCDGQPRTRRRHGDRPRLHRPGRRRRARRRAARAGADPGPGLPGRTSSTSR